MAQLQALEKWAVAVQALEEQALGVQAWQVELLRLDGQSIPCSAEGFAPFLHVNNGNAGAEYLHLRV